MRGVASGAPHRRSDGRTDGDAVELVGHTTGATLSNYLRHLSGVPIDFPRVEFASTRQEHAG